MSNAKKLLIELLEDEDRKEMYKDFEKASV